MKKLLAPLGILLALTMTVPMAFALNPAPYNGLNKGKSGVYHLYLYEKDANWNIVGDGAWGKLTFSSKGFIFNGHGLEVGWGYTLIYYGFDSHNDEWPYATCLASGTANSGGNINLSGDFDLAAFMGDNVAQKIWLILSNDVDCGNHQMTGWNPTEYLFEYNTI